MCEVVDVGFVLGKVERIKGREGKREEGESESLQETALHLLIQE